MPRGSHSICLRHAARKAGVAVLTRTPVRMFPILASSDESSHNIASPVECGFTELKRMHIRGTPGRALEITHTLLSPLFLNVEDRTWPTDPGLGEEMLHLDCC